MEKSITTQIRPYQSSASLILQKASAMQIKTDDDMKEAITARKEIKAVGNKFDELKSRYTRPANDILKQAREMFGPVIKIYEEAEKIINNKMISYDGIKRNKAAKKMAELEAKIMAGKISLEKASVKMEKVAAPNNYNSGENSLIFRTIKDVEITDKNRIPSQYMEPNLSFIKTELLKGIKIPGAELIEKRIPVSA